MIEVRRDIMAILELKNVKKSYGYDDNKVVAVNNVSLSIEEGSFVAIVGKSGSGKSSLLHVMGGLTRPQKGVVLLEGQSLYDMNDDRLSRYRRRRMGFVFQFYNLISSLNVIENIILPIHLDHLKEDQEYIDELLELLDLKEKKTAFVRELSGGQQQRVALVRSLITKPKVLLLDEPLSNLDAKLRVKMREEIREIQKKYEITMVFVTHDQEEAMVLGDKIAIMDQGKLVQIGRPEEVYLHPQNDFARDFLGISNQFTDMRGNHICCRPEELEFVDNGTLSLIHI